MKIPGVWAAITIHISPNNSSTITLYVFLYIKTHTHTFIFHIQFQEELQHHGNIIFLYVCNNHVQYVTNVVPSTSSCSLNNNKVGPPAMKNLSLWLDCWGEISQVSWKARHENILWDCKQLIGGRMCLAKSEPNRVFHVFGKCGVHDPNH